MADSEEDGKEAGEMADSEEDGKEAGEMADSEEDGKEAGEKLKEGIPKLKEAELNTGKRGKTPPTDRELAARFRSASIYIPKPTDDEYKYWKETVNEWYCCKKLNVEDAMLAVEIRANDEPNYCNKKDAFLLRTHYHYEKWKMFREAAFALTNLTPVIWSARNSQKTCRGKLKSFFQDRMPTLPFTVDQIKGEIKYIKKKIKEQTVLAEKAAAQLKQASIDEHFIKSNPSLKTELVTESMKKLKDAAENLRINLSAAE